MQEIVVSLNKNLLKVINVEEENLFTTSSDVSVEIVNDSAIKDPNLFARKLEELIPKVTEKNKEAVKINFCCRASRCVIAVCNC